MHAVTARYVAGADGVHSSVRRIAGIDFPGDAPAALFALIRGLPPRRAGWTGATFGLGLFAFGTYWLYTCLHVFGLVPLWLTGVLQAALMALMASSLSRTRASCRATAITCCSVSASTPTAISFITSWCDADPCL